MADDMYPEGEASNATENEREDDGAETALLPKSLFGGDCKVGDEYKVKVVGVLEDELEVEPIKEAKESESPGKSRMEMAGSKLDEMDGEYS